MVTPLNSTLCSYNDLQCLNTIYPTIVTIPGLERHNDGQTTVLNCLETIWRQALNICTEAQFYNHQYVQQFLISQMWRLKFGQDSFETLLYQLSLLQ